MDEPDGEIHGGLVLAMSVMLLRPIIASWQSYVQLVRLSCSDACPTRGYFPASLRSCTDFGARTNLAEEEALISKDAQQDSI